MFRKRAANVRSVTRIEGVRRCVNEACRAFSRRLAWRRSCGRWWCTRSSRPDSRGRGAERPGGADQVPQQPAGQSTFDPAAEAVAVRDVSLERPEQQMTEHDRSPAFDTTRPAPINAALGEQPNQGARWGSTSRDPLGAPEPFTDVSPGVREGERRPRRGDGGAAAAAGGALRLDAAGSIRRPR